MNNRKTEKTKVIRVFESFAGIGAQHQAISNIDPDNNFLKIIGTSEWDARAIIAYAQMHNYSKFQKYLLEVKNWSEKEIDFYCQKHVFSLNSKKPSLITRKKLIFKQNLIAANKANNNFSDIRNLESKTLSDQKIDLLVYSFPCQGLSIANMGRDQGLSKKSNSTSNLIWEIHRLLSDLKKQNLLLPKYLLMENVNNILGPKHIKDYQKWIKILKNLGYQTKTLKLNGLDFGSLQKRTRVFAISILNWKNNQTDKQFQEQFIKDYGFKMSLEKRKERYLEILNSSINFEDEILDAIPNETDSRKKMASENNDLEKRKWILGQEWTFNTLTTKQDRHPNIGMISLKPDQLKLGKLNKRYITNREAYLIMGFPNAKFDKVKEKYKEDIMTKESLYRQAGNSIVVEILEKLFIFFKNYHGGENG